MWDDGPSVLDLALISFLSFLLWAMERAWGSGEGAAETPIPKDAKPVDSRKFLWRCKVFDGNIKIDIWKAQDSTSSRP